MLLTGRATSDLMRAQDQIDPFLAPAITRSASLQTFYTVRFLVDKDRVLDAYRAYAYFRWVDDQLDGGGWNAATRLAFVERQAALVDQCYRGDWPQHLQAEERLLVDLIQNDQEPDSGLQSYIRHMMAVMAFDAERRGHLITEAELHHYTIWLATAVTEALHYFIGHDCAAPHNRMRCLAAAGAHITHMLRDTMEDIEAGYFNIPREVVERTGISPDDVTSAPYRAWVMSRVQLAREYFRAGRAHLAHVESLRCRIAGYAYMARFEGVLDAIERDGYRLRSSYPECKGLGKGLEMGWLALSQAFSPQHPVFVSQRLSATQG